MFHKKIWGLVIYNTVQHFPLCFMPDFFKLYRTTLLLLLLLWMIFIYTWCQKFGSDTNLLAFALKWADGNIFLNVKQKAALYDDLILFGLHLKIILILMHLTFRSSLSPINQWTDENKLKERKMHVYFCSLQWCVVELWRLLHYNYVPLNKDHSHSSENGSV